MRRAAHAALVALTAALVPVHSGAHLAIVLDERVGSVMNFGPVERGSRSRVDRRPGAAVAAAPVIAWPNAGCRIAAPSLSVVLAALTFADFVMRPASHLRRRWLTCHCDLCAPSRCCSAVTARSMIQRGRLMVAHG
jgi:hypothetical protein